MSETTPTHPWAAAWTALSPQRRTALWARVVDREPVAELAERLGRTVEDTEALVAAAESAKGPAGESLEVIEPATWLSCSGAAYQAHSGGEIIVVGDSQTFFTGSNEDFSSKVLTVPPS